MLQTRNIFLDASIFIGLNFNYNHPSLEQLSKLVEEDRVCLILTTVTVSEVEANIKTGVQKSVQAHAKFGRDAKVLRNLEDPQYQTLFDSLNTAEVERLLIEQFRSFLSSANALILSPPATSTEAVFSRYFGKEPPFGEGKKKHEFPDAFALVTLETWCEQNDEKIYVISQDPDMRAFCEGHQWLFWLENLSNFLDVLLFHDEKLAPSVDRIVKAHLTEFEATISKQFPDRGFWLDDQDGEVLEVIVQDVEIKEHNLIQISKDNAAVEVLATVNFSADIEYNDLETAIYDSEDKVLIPWNKINTIVERSEQINATIHLQIDAKDANYFQMKDVEINIEKPRDVYITVIEDEYPYK